MTHSKRFQWSRILFFTSIVLAVTGCGLLTNVDPQTQCNFLKVKFNADAPTEPVLVPPIPGSVTPMPLNAVNVTDNSITNKVIVQSTNAKRLETGEIEVFARVVNCTDYPLQVEARTHFLDARRVDAEPTTAWNRLHIPGHATGGYSERSTAGNTVQNYLIDLREGR